MLMPHPKKLCFHISQNFEVQVNSHCAVSAAGINTGDRRPIVRQFGKFDLTTSTQHQPTQTIINMQRFIVFVSFLACAAAAPGLLVAHASPVVASVHAVPVVGSKTTITKSSQVVNHGSPVVHAVHTPVVAAVPVVKAAVVAPVVHAVHAAPVVHAVHAAPVVHAVHAAPVVHAVHAAPVVVKTVPSAVSHSSSVVSHTPIKALPVVAVH
ncbi:hypothetical protein KGM_211490 [Danaus plexippus plexippus]|uniref:Uncharacterized protein n=1 Tax=Danaus plexippus plexippus TaxID=278856 RepID=A0A212FF66_DANPL|nr:hypothetical protein KGM_211490 [Danaus plexippus plexippus]